MANFKMLLVFFIFGIANAQELGNCDFENGLCGYTKSSYNINNPRGPAPQFQWERSRSATPSFNTGPFSDHNGSKTKFYLYTESSAPASSRDVAVLTSPSVTKQRPFCLAFWYHAHGENMGELHVDIVPAQVSNGRVFTTKGNKGLKWLKFQKQLTIRGSFQVKFSSYRSSSTSDMAIDDITMNLGDCPEIVEEEVEKPRMNFLVRPIYDECPIEKGHCIKENGHDQNSGVIKKNSKDGNTEAAQKECLEICKNHFGATGCEVIWSQGNRGCYIHTQEVARGNNARRHMCWVFSKCSKNPDVNLKSCPIESGLCVKENGLDQNSGVRKLHHYDVTTPYAEADCFKRCSTYRYGEITGCEVIWNQGNRGCYLHSQPISRGNGIARHMCWVFSKCTTSKVPATTAPKALSMTDTYFGKTELDPIIGVKRIGCYRMHRHRFRKKVNMKGSMDPLSFIDRVKQCRDIVNNKEAEFEIFGVSRYGSQCDFYLPAEVKNEKPKPDSEDCHFDTMGGDTAYYVYKLCKDEKQC